MTDDRDIAEDVLLSAEGPDALKQARDAQEHRASIVGSAAGEDDWVKKYIESREQRGKEWRARLKDHQDLAKTSHYIRILGDGFRPVSISDENPCGALLDHNGEEIKGYDELELAIVEARSDRQQSRTPKVHKHEHQLQAYLIRTALDNNLRFGHVLSDFSEVFDELIFVTDELAIRPGVGGTECRADIVALGSKGGQFFPVFIELKTKRRLSRLRDQLDNACDLLWKKDDRTRKSFGRFLSAVSGVSVEQIDASENAARKMLVWPNSPSGKEAKEVDETRQEGFLIAEFDMVESNPRYRFSRKSFGQPRN